MSFSSQLNRKRIKLRNQGIRPCAEQYSTLQYVDGCAKRSES